MPKLMGRAMRNTCLLVMRSCKSCGGMVAVLVTLVEKGSKFREKQVSKKPYFAALICQRLYSTYPPPKKPLTGSIAG
jgi:hypothetical protein